MQLSYLNYKIFWRQTYLSHFKTWKRELEKELTQTKAEVKCKPIYPNYLLLSNVNKENIRHLTKLGNY